MYEDVLVDEQADEYIRNHITRGYGHSIWRTSDEAFDDMLTQDLALQDKLDDDLTEEWDSVDVDFTVGNTSFVFPPGRYYLKDIELKFDCCDEFLLDSKVRLHTSCTEYSVPLAPSVLLNRALGKRVIEYEMYTLVPLYLTETFPEGVFPVVRHGNRLEVIPKGKAKFIGIRYKMVPLYSTPTFDNFSTFFLFKATNFSFGCTRRIFHTKFWNEPLLGFVIPYTTKIRELSRVIFTCYPNDNDNKSKTIIKHFELNESIHLVKDPRNKPIFYIFGFSSIFTSAKRFIQWTSRKRYFEHTAQEDTDCSTRLSVRDIGELHCFNHIRIDHITIHIEGAGESACELDGSSHYDGTLYSIHMRTMVNRNGIFIPKYTL